MATTNELAEAIRAGPQELNLCDNIFFRRRSLSNPPIFHDFLNALRENTTIAKLTWRPRFSNNLSPDQRVQAYQVIGTMASLVELDIAAPLTEQSPIGIACQAPNLRILKMNTTMSLRYDATAQEGLIDALTSNPNLQLREFECLFASHTTESLDPLLEVLADDTVCKHLERVHVTTTHPVSGTAMSALLKSRSIQDLQFATVLPRDLSWDFPRVPSCIWKDLCENLKTSTLKKLRLVTSYEIDALTEHVVAIAKAVRFNTHLEYLALESTCGFQDEACIALAQALKFHPTLQKVVVAGDDWRNSQFHLESERSYNAFSQMLRHKYTGMTVTIGKPIDETVCAKQRVHYRDMVVQMILHQAGRYELMQTMCQKAWIQTMAHINGLELAEPYHSWAIQDDKDWELFKLECIMWMVRENPLVTKRYKERRKESMQFKVTTEQLRESMVNIRRKSMTNGTTTDNDNEE